MATLAQQLKHAICDCECYGQSRHRDKSSGDDLSWKVYSVGEKQQLEKRAADLGSFISSAFPDVKRVVDIRPNHLQAWLDSKADSCAQTTLDVYISNCKKIGDICEHEYNATHMHTDRLEAPKSTKTDVAIKDRVMDKKRLSMLIDELRRTGTQAWKAVELADSIGLRVDECAHLHLECVTLTGGKYGCGEVTLRGSVDGAKHGRSRVIAILSPQDRDRVERCLEGAKSGQTVIQKADGTPYKAESLDRAMSRAMERINRREGRDVFGSEWKESKMHSLRKAFSQRCWDTAREETADTMSEKASKREATAFVNAQLGHGDTRTDSIATYVHDAW